MMNQTMHKAAEMQPANSWKVKKLNLNTKVTLTAATIKWKKYMNCMPTFTGRKGAQER